MYATILYMSNKNHFFYPYPGNKRQELKYIDSHLDLSNVKIIIEPYCGSSSISNYIFNQHDKDNNFKYILNDSDNNLISLYKLIQNTKTEEGERNFNLFQDNINIFIDNFNKFETDAPRKEFYNKTIKEATLESYFIKQKYFCLRAGMYPLISKTKQITKINLIECPIYNFITKANIILSGKNALEIIEEYKDNEQVLMIMDPPYIMTCNTFYSDCNASNLYACLFNRTFNYKCKIMLILENMWINKMLFKELNDIFYIKEEYNKTYQMSKNKTTHIIICNY